MVGRRGDPALELLVGDRLQARGIVAVGVEPLDEVVVVDVVLLELLARLVHVVDVGVDVGGVDLAAALVDRAEYGFDARGGLRHERRGARGGDRQHGDIAAAHLHHLVVEGRIGLADAGDHGVGGLLRRVVDGEGAALRGHLHRGAVGGQRERLLHLHGEGDRLVGAVAQPKRREHVALGRDAEARAAALLRHRADLLPQLELHAAHLLVLGIVVDLGDDLLDLLQLQVDDVVHHAHGHADMAAELVEVEARLRGEGLLDIAQQVERQQAARVVGAERNLAAGVGRNRHEALVGIAVGDALAQDRIPEQHARLGRLPGVVDDLGPQLLRVDLLLVERVLRRDGELLAVGSARERRTHELVVDLDRDVGARHLARVDLGVDEALGVGVLDREREHQRAATAVLRHLARGVGVALHEGDDARRREGRVEHGAVGRAQVREVVAHAAAPLHELHLLLVDAEDAAVGVGGVLVADDEAVGERRHLEIVADAGHRTALRDHVAEVVEQREELLLGERLGVVALDARQLAGDAAVHLAGRALVDVAERILEGVFGDPDRGGQVVTLEVAFRLGDGVVVVDALRRVGVGGF